MLDSDLADLYQVTTGNLNLAVRRNLARFPADFMFQMAKEEGGSLLLQSARAKKGRGGRRTPPYVFTELGVAMLSSVLSAAATLGLGALLMSSARLFGLAKLLGASYLFYLGVRHLFRGAPPIADAGTVNGGTSSARRVAGYREGLLLAVTNPKPILFFTALFPQFLNTRSPIFPQFLALTGIFMVLSFVTLITYASIARRARALLIRTRVADWINRTLGLVFIGFAALLLMYRRPATQ